MSTGGVRGCLAFYGNVISSGLTRCHMLSDDKQFDLEIDEEERLDLIIDCARRTGLTIDYLDSLTSGLTLSCCLRVIGNASSIPSYMKSRDNPYIRRKVRAASMLMRC